jgi:uncharacterized protein YegL
MLPAVVLAVAVPAGSGRGAAAPVCDAVATKVGAPAVVRLGDEVSVTMTVRASCSRIQVPIHAVLVVDSSVDMGGSRMSGLREAIGAFVDALDLSRSRVGLVAYNGIVAVLADLTADGQVVKDAAAGLFPRRGSDLRVGVRTGRLLLERARSGIGPGDVQEVLVVLSGSQFEGDRADVLAEAARARDAGILVVTVAATGNADAGTLAAMASSPAHFYTEGESSRYRFLLPVIASDVTAVHITGAQVVDTLSPGVDYSWGSGVPAPRLRGSDLSWAYAVWPAEGITITYAVQPRAIGRQSLSARAEVTLALDRGAPQNVLFPPVTVDVVLPPTPSAVPPSATVPPPTTTPTPVPWPAFLPLVARSFCRPSAERADAILLIDTSAGMMRRGAGRRVTLELVQIAATDLVGALVEAGHRAAVVTFASGAVVRQRLTGERIPLELALADIYRDVGSGDRIDLGLVAAMAELADAPDRAGRTGVILVVTDGFEPSARGARAEAGVEQAGVDVYAVGIGPAADLDRLGDLTGSPARVHRTPDAGDLDVRFATVLRQIGCAPGPRP